MNRFTRILATPAAILAATAAWAQAPEYSAPSYGETYLDEAYRPGVALPQQELDQVLAPIALYPDALLSQLLMASTYPGDIAQAAQWSRANPNLQGEDAVRAVENEPWHPSVKSMVAFPEVLKAMGEQPQWVERLGGAFLAQEATVMQTVQQLRSRADQAGNLQSNGHIAVERNGGDYVISPSSPETVDVPYYDPRVVYGNWWWPQYQPIYWRPWAGYSYYGGWGWGSSVYVGTGFFYGGFNWGRRHVHYASHRPYYWGHHHNYARGWQQDRYQNRSARWGNGNEGGSYGGRGSGGQDPGVRVNTQRAPQQPNYNGGERPRFVGGEPLRSVEGSAARASANAGVRTVAPRYSMDGRVGGTGYRNRGELTVQQPVQQAGTAQRGTFVPGERVGTAGVAAPRMAQSKPLYTQPAQAQPMPRMGQPKPAMAQPAPRMAPPAPRVAQPQQAFAHSKPGGAQPAQRYEAQRYEARSHAAPTQRMAGPSPRANHDGNRGGGDRGGNNGNNGGGRGRER